MLKHKNRRQIDRYFASELSSADATEMFAALAHVPEAKAYFERRRLLAQLDPKAPSERHRIAKSVALESPKNTWKWGWAAPALLATLAVMTLWIRPIADDGFIARGDASLAHVSVFQVDAAGAPVQESIAANAELAFAFQTPQAAHLMIFAVQGTERVYWFYPAWTDPASNPTSIAVPATVQPTELADAVRHQFRPGPLTLFAVFSETPLDVQSVEAALANMTTPIESLPFSGSHWSMQLQVVAP